MYQVHFSCFSKRSEERERPPWCAFKKNIYPQGGQIVRCNKNMHSVCLWNDFNTMESVKYDDYINYPHLEKTYSNNLKPFAISLSFSRPLF